MCPTNHPAAPCPYTPPNSNNTKAGSYLCLHDTTKATAHKTNPMPSASNPSPAPPKGTPKCSCPALSLWRRLSHDKKAAIYAALVGSGGEGDVDAEEEEEEEEVQCVCIPAGIMEQEIFKVSWQ